MSPARDPVTNPADIDPTLDGQVSAVPDEDGPHDVPDEEVIEQTLPTVPVSDLGSRS
jgi:hypothetical protein